MIASEGDTVGVEKPAETPRRREWWAISAILGAFIIFNLATANIYPSVWSDEVWFSEPAANYALHGSFTTTTWSLQPGHTYPAVNCPLYPLILVPWLKLFGTGIVAIRSLNYTLMALAGFLLWQISWRYNLVRPATLRILLLSVAFFAYGTSFAYRCSRPDVLALACLLVMVLAFKIRRRWALELSLLALGMTATWIGLQVGLYASAACFFAWLWLGWVSFRQILALAIGLAAGFLGVIAFFATQRVLPYFLPMVIGWLGKRYAHAAHSRWADRVGSVIESSISSYVTDFSTLLLTVGLLALLALRWSCLPGRIRRLCLFCLALSFGAPVLFNLVGHFTFYYAYTRLIPTAVGFFAAWTAAGQKGAPESPSISVRVVCWGTLGLAIVLGMPLRFAATLSSTNLVSPAHLQRMITTNLLPTDVVFCEHAAFFQCKKVAATVYDLNYSTNFFYMHVQGHDFTPQEKQAVNVLVVWEERAQSVTNYFGGSWVPQTKPFGERIETMRVESIFFIGKRLLHYLSQPQCERHPLQIFRRQPGGA